jgi:hypothetical protein
LKSDKEVLRSRLQAVQLAATAAREGILRGSSAPTVVVDDLMATHEASSFLEIFDADREILAEVNVPQQTYLSVNLVFLTEPETSCTKSSVISESF